jgi:hypothetical protein
MIMERGIGPGPPLAKGQLTLFRDEDGGEP